MVNDNYIRKIVRSVGVPELWADDALQDVHLRLWLAQDERSIVVRRAAIDAARKYGRHSRKGVVRLAVPLEALCDADNYDDDDVVRSQYAQPFTHDACETVNNMLDTAQALKKLVPRHLALIQRRVTDGPVSAGAWTNVDHMGLSNARKRLRELTR